jgi:hypothetical protein
MPAPPHDLNDEMLSDVLCVADTKWVLGHWYIKAMQNGRSLTDFNALSAMAQDQLGHTRALFSLLEQSHELPQNRLEFERGDHQIHNLDALDAPPENWADFILTSWLTEQALLARFSAVAQRMPLVASLAAQCRRECEFHIMYLEGNLEGFSPEEIEAGKLALVARAPLVARWLQDLGREVQSQQFERVGKLVSAWGGHASIATETSPITDSGWDRARRRPAGTSMPASLWEFVLPTSEQAVMCRRPLTVSTDDSIRFTAGG